MLPYTFEVWFGAVGRMNADLAVFVVIACLLGVFLVALTWFPVLADHRGSAAINRRVALALGAGWVASGSVFFGGYLEPFFFAAQWLMAGFIFQGLLLIALATVRPLPAPTTPGVAVWGGRALMLYALVAMPLVDLALGPGWPSMRVIGLAPEPTIVLTCGWLLTRQPSWRVSGIALLPLAAAAFAGYTAWAFAWSPDFIVPLAALAAAGVPTAAVLAGRTSTAEEHGNS